MEVSFENKKKYNHEINSLINEITSSNNAGHFYDDYQDFQTRLDKLASIYQNDTTIGKLSYKLYEAQAYIWFYNGNDDKALEFMQEAVNTYGSPFKNADLLEKAIYSRNPSLNNDYTNVKMSPFDGWLRFWIVTMVIDIIVNIYFFSTFYKLNIANYVLSAQSSVTSYKDFGMFFNASLIILPCIILYLMSKRLRATKVVTICCIVWVLVGACILYSTGTSAIQSIGGNTSSASTSPSVFGAILWLIYWIRSKEVKKVFVN